MTYEADWAKIASEIEDERERLAAMVDRVEDLADEWEAHASLFDGKDQRRADALRGKVSELRHALTGGES